MPLAKDNPWYDYLEADPEGRRGNYFTFEDAFARSPNRRKYFRDQFSDVQDQYMAQLAQIAKGGGQPNLGWTDYLEDYFSPQGEADQDYSDYGLRSGGNRNAFAPPLRWMTQGGPSF